MVYGYNSKHDGNQSCGNCGNKHWGVCDKCTDCRKEVCDRCATNCNPADDKLTCNECLEDLLAPGEPRDEECEPPLFVDVLTRDAARAGMAAGPSQYDLEWFWAWLKHNEKKPLPIQ